MRIKKSKSISALLSPLYFFVNNLAKNGNSKKTRHKMLVIFLGYIGDYILFRNFISEIKKDSRYKGYSITLCGDPLWKNISENLDKKEIDKFIWIDRKKFLSNPFYGLDVLRKMKSEFFDIVISPNFGRSFGVDSLAKITKSKQKIGNAGSLESIFSWQKKISDKYYTRLIDTKSKFEFSKNKEFFEQFLGKKLHTKLSIPFKKANKKKDYVVFVPGAGAKFREWSPRNFARVADFLIQNYKLKIKIIGSEKDSEIANAIIRNSKYPKRMQNLTGSQFIDSINLIGNSKLVISNDTGPFHIAVATGSPTILISNGNTFGKFHPYPDDMSKKIEHVYPPEIDQMSFERVVRKYYGGSNLKINSIPPNKVIEKINVILC